MEINSIKEIYGLLGRGVRFDKMVVWNDNDGSILEKYWSLLKVAGLWD